MQTRTRCILIIARFWMLLATLEVPAYAQTGPQPDPKNVERGVSIDIATWPGFGMAFVAREKGFLQVPAQIRVVDDFSARRVSFTSGRSDFTIYTVDSLAFDAAAGVRGVVVLAIDQSAGADGIIARTPIDTAQALRGKTIALTEASPSQFLLSYYLREARVPLSALKQMYVDDPTRAAQAFSGRAVDAAVTWEPNLSELQKQPDVVTLFTSKQAPDLIIDVLVASPAIVKQRPDAVEAVVNGWLQAVDYYHRNTADAQRIMAGGLKLSDTELAGMMGGLILYDRKQNQRLFPARLGTAHPSHLVSLFESAAQLWKHEGLTNRAVSPQGYFRSDFIQHARE